MFYSNSGNSDINGYYNMCNSYMENQVCSTSSVMSPVSVKMDNFIDKLTEYLTNTPKQCALSPFLPSLLQRAIASNHCNQLE